MADTKVANTQKATDYYLPQNNGKLTGKSELGKNDFLKILVTQLQNQDPTKPMEDKDFIAQMAQFSSLEQMTNIATEMSKLTAVTQQSQLVQFNSFIGKTITWHDTTKNLDSNNKPIVETGTGKIASVKYDGSEAKFILEDGKVITAANITEVKNADTNSNQESLVNASMLIGKKVTYDAKDSGSMTETVTSVVKKDGKIQYILSNGSSVTADQFTAISS